MDDKILIGHMMHLDKDTKHSLTCKLLLYMTKKLQLQRSLEKIYTHFTSILETKRIRGENIVGEGLVKEM